jgi:hypothetical protein
MRRLSFLGDEPWNEFGEEGDVVYFPEGRDGLHDFSNPAAKPARIVGISTRRFPDVLVYPERGVAWVATRHPERPVRDDRLKIQTFRSISADGGRRTHRRLSVRGGSLQRSR